MITRDGETEIFSILTGVLQGDTLAPYLFVLLLDNLREAIDGREEGLGFYLFKRQSKRIGQEVMTDLSFAEYTTPFCQRKYNSTHKK